MKQINIPQNQPLTWSLIRFIIIIPSYSWFLSLSDFFNPNLGGLFRGYASGIQLPGCSNLTINRNNVHDVIIFWHDVIIKTFWCYFVFFIKFSYWSKFHVNIIAGSAVMTIFFYKGLTKYPEIGNTPVGILPNIWRLGQVRDTKFDTNVSNKMLLNAAKCQGYSFYCFGVI